RRPRRSRIGSWPRVSQVPRPEAPPRTREGFRGEGAYGGLAGLHLLAASALAARDVRMDGLVLPAQIPSVVDGKFRAAPFGGADPTSRVRTVGPRELADASSAVCRVGHRSSPRLGSTSPRLAG